MLFLFLMFFCCWLFVAVFAAVVIVCFVIVVVVAFVVIVRCFHRILMVLFVDVVVLLLLLLLCCCLLFVFLLMVVVFDLAFDFWYIVTKAQLVTSSYFWFLIQCMTTTVYSTTKLISFFLNMFDTSFDTLIQQFRFDSSSRTLRCYQSKNITYINKLKSTR